MGRTNIFYILNVLFPKLASPQHLFRLDYISLGKCSVTFYSGLSGLLLGLILTIWGVYLLLWLGFFSMMCSNWSLTFVGKPLHTILYTVQFNHSVVSNSLWPHGPQHTRPPCPSPTPGVYSNSFPLSGWCHPVISSSGVSFSSCLQSFPSIRVFSNESVLHIRRPKYWTFSFSISPSNEHPGLISFRMDWLDLLAVPGTLKSLLQHHSSKTSIISSTFLIFWIIFLNFLDRLHCVLMIVLSFPN